MVNWNLIERPVPPGLEHHVRQLVGEEFGDTLLKTHNSTIHEIALTFIPEGGLVRSWGVLLGLV